MIQLIAPHALASKLHNAICPISGASYSLDLHGLAAAGTLCFEVQSPFASFANVQKLLADPKANILEAATAMQAATIIAFCHHYSLLATKLSALEANTLLQQCSGGVLAKLLISFKAITPSIAERLPALRLEASLLKPATSQEAFLQDLNDLLLGWNKAIRAYLPSTELAKFMQQSADAGITICHIKAPLLRKELALAKLKQPKLAPNEVPTQKTSAFKEAEIKFQQDRKRGKELCKDLINSRTITNTKLLEALRALFKNRALSTCNSSMRGKICTALQRYGTPAAFELSDLISNAANPYDLLATSAVYEAEAAIEEAMQPAAKAFSLQDLIAAKRNGCGTAVSATMQDPRSGKERRFTNEWDEL